jgi:hypothetical protein
MQHIISQTVMVSMLVTMISGCNILPWRQKEVRRAVDPALPMTLNRDELVAYINSQHAGLSSWRSTKTKLSARFPGMPTQRLSGSIACQYPQQFRLIAHNVLGQADLGSNSDRCWFYTRPGDPAVITWRHEDTRLLQQVQTGVPYIDPNWLMLVLGVKPLEASDYVLSAGPQGSRQLWLTAIEETPSGRPLRRSIKVDTVEGVVKEHTIHDSEAHLLVRAALSNHQSCGGHMIPGAVRLEFPQMDSEIVLRFSDVETNPDLPASLWLIPESNSTPLVDLGDVIRQRLYHQGLPVGDQGLQTASLPPEAQSFVGKSDIRLQQPVFDQQSPFAEIEQSLDDDRNSPAVAAHAIAEPNWDYDAEEDGANPFAEDAPVQGASHQTEQPAATKSASGIGLWPWSRAQ